jgi:hypothetical protein
MLTTLLYEGQYLPSGLIDEILVVENTKSSESDATLRVSF